MNIELVNEPITETPEQQARREETLAYAEQLTARLRAEKEQEQA